MSKDTVVAVVVMTIGLALVAAAELASGEMFVTPVAAVAGLTSLVLILRKERRERK